MALHNTTNQTFGFVSGPFGPTPHLPPFTSMAPPPVGLSLVDELTASLPDVPTVSAIVLTPDNARDNSQAKGLHPGNHPLTFNGG